MIRLAIIGSGPIIPFHLAAFKSLGFSFEILVYRSNVQLASDLQVKYGISMVTSNIEDLDNVNIDCILLATSAESLSFLLQKIVKYGVPILVEKPVATSSQVFASLPESAKAITQVGYNRRFYSSVKTFRKQVELKSNVLFEIKLPENSWNGINSIKSFNSNLKLNTVHGIDLLYFIFGKDCTTDFVDCEVSEDKVDLIRCKISSGSSSGILTITNGVPDNYLITAFGRGWRMELSPLEIFSLYNGIEVQEPNLESPIRRYLPMRDLDWKISNADITYKPGFLAQAESFKHFLDSGQLSSEAATLEDASRTITFCETIEKLVEMQLKK